MASTTPTTPDDLDLSGLDPRGAREYVLAFVRTLKEAEQRRGRLEAELRLWTERAALARSKGRADLAGAADARAAGIEPNLAEAQAEETRLRAQVSGLKERLRLKRHAEIERSVDSEKLEAELEMLVGEEGASDAKFGSAQAASDLDELRKRLRSE